jgi:hypothetical protein
MTPLLPLLLIAMPPLLASIVSEPGDGRLATLAPCSTPAAGQRWRLAADGWGSNATLTNAAVDPQAPVKCLAVTDWAVGVENATVGEYGCAEDREPGSEGTFNQRWGRQDDQLRVFTAAGVPSTMCLTAASAAPGAGVHIATCRSVVGVLQRWHYLPSTGGLQLLQPGSLRSASPAMCLSTGPPPLPPAVLLHNTSFADVRGFSYQPYFPSVGGTGDAIWGNPAVFDLASIDADFLAAKQTFPKVNVMRLWMSLDGFISNPTGYPAQLASVLALGPKHRIRFVVTLFNNWQSIPDFGGKHAVQAESIFFLSANHSSPTSVPTQAFLEAVVLPHATNPSILVWDIVNEPDGAWKNFVVRTARWLRSSARVEASIGVSCAPGMGCLEEFNDNETQTDVLLIHPYCPGCFLGGPGESGMEGFAASLNQYVSVANARNLPLLATETCWGSMNDSSRALSCSFELGELKKRNIGFCPHGLRYSKVADLHNYSGGPVCTESGYMAFLQSDRSLRAHHQVYNLY